MSTSLEAAIAERDAKWRQAFRSIMFGGPLPSDVDYVDLGKEFQKARDESWANARQRADDDSREFVTEMICRCAAALHVASAALKVDWGSLSYDGPEPLPQFIKALEQYAELAARAKAAAGGAGAKGR